ncbi:hypothetical protein PYH37_000568 [Sinorhizobium numidicum]|uniref:Transmembrane protein n=1 Tax=Sinorhizobium numidicum TaxID=680248 RepID=A0ABY8CVA1_9HYPH|nr:hypothetical protein [Sinorhizobium numidicum]WEX75194.1 hypothetical protein PYH37_000568 [Sinorhizobium numidicum]WEX81188.1 hypothetical protein PYH38_000570 [Sinorhizobium numidicum]
MSSDIILIVVFWAGVIVACAYAGYWCARRGDKVGQWVCVFMAVAGLLGLVASL